MHDKNSQLTFDMSPIVVRWLSLTDKQNSGFELATKLVKSQLHFSPDQLEFVMNDTAKPRVIRTIGSSTNKVFDRLTRKLIKYFSQLFTQVNTVNVDSVADHSREVSVQIGYMTTCLCEMIFQTYQIARLVAQAKFESSIKSLQAWYVSFKTRSQNSVAVLYSMTKLLTSLLILRVALNRTESLDEYFKQLIDWRKNLRNQLQNNCRPVRNFDLVTLLVSVKYWEYLFKDKRYGCAVAFIKKCNGNNSPFGESVDLRQAFAKQTNKLYSFDMDAKEDTNCQKVIKQRCQSVTPGRSLRQLSTTSKSRKLSTRNEQPITTQPNKYRRLRISQSKQGFFTKNQKSLPRPCTSSIYSHINNIKQVKISTEELHREIVQFNDRQKFSNAPTMHRTTYKVSNGKIDVKKSKLIKRTKANESLRHTIVQTILMRSILKTEIRFIYFGLERPELISMDLLDQEELHLCIKMNNFSYKHRIRREESQNNNQVLTEWPAAKYLFKRWLKKEDLLRNIDRTLTVNEYEIDESSLPLQLRMLQRPEIMDIIELRETIKVFIKCTLYNKRSINGSRFILNNKIPITKLHHKSFIKNLKSLRELKSGPIKFDDVVDVIEPYECPIIAQHTVLHKGEYMLISSYLSVSDFIRSLNITAEGVSLNSEAIEIEVQLPSKHYLKSVRFPLQQFRERMLCDNLALYLIKCIIMGTIRSNIASFLVEYISKGQLTESEQFVFGERLTCHYFEEHTTSNGDRESVEPFPSSNINIFESETEAMIAQCSSDLIKVEKSDTQPFRYAEGEVLGRINHLRRIDICNGRHALLFQKTPTEILTKPFWLLNRRRNYYKRVTELQIDLLSMVHHRILEYVSKINGRMRFVSVSVYIRQHRLDDFLKWIMQFYVFDGKAKPKILTLTSVDYRLIFNRHTSTCNSDIHRSVQDVLKKLLVYRNSVYSRVGLGNVVNLSPDTLFTNRHSNSLTMLKSHTSSSYKLLSQYTQFRHFVHSRTIKYKCEYAVIIIYRIGLMINLSYDIEMHCRNGEIWATTICLATFECELQLTGMFSFEPDEMRGQQMERQLWQRLLKQIRPDQLSQKLLVTQEKSFPLRQRLLLSISNHTSPSDVMELLVWEVTISQVERDASLTRIYKISRQNERTTDIFDIAEAQLLALYRSDPLHAINLRQRVTQKELASYLHCMFSHIHDGGFPSVT